jgi:hypothetical protein
VSDGDVDLDKLRADVAAAMAEVFTRHECGSLITAWVAIVETYAGDGRGVWTLAPADSTTRDSLGLLTQAIEIERAAIVTSQVVAALQEG